MGRWRKNSKRVYLPVGCLSNLQSTCISEDNFDFNKQNPISRRFEGWRYHHLKTLKVGSCGWIKA
jgi:hypothetical protein